MRFEGPENPGWAMTIESLVDHFGYLAILVGTFLEGESILVMGGFAGMNFKTANTRK